MNIGIRPSANSCLFPHYKVDGQPNKNQKKSYFPRSADRTPTHNAHLCSTVCSQARNAHHALGSSHHGLHFIFVRLKRICHLVLHIVSPLVFVSLAFHHEDVLFLIHSSFYYDTRTRSTTGTTRTTPRTPSTSRTSPSSLSRQAAPSRISLA